MPDTNIRPLAPRDRDWVQILITERWGAAIVVAHGRQYLPHELPGFVAMQDGTPVGLLTYHIEADACEIVTIDSLRPDQGIGTLLLDAVNAAARANGCRRLWLITTNDNLNALRFYQKRGLRLVAVHRGAVTRSRELKPEIPLIGDSGIPVCDEIELERILSDA